MYLCLQPTFHLVGIADAINQQCGAFGFAAITNRVSHADRKPSTMLTIRRHGKLVFRADNASERNYKIAQRVQDFFAMLDDNGDPVAPPPTHVVKELRRIERLRRQADDLNEQADQVEFELLVFAAAHYGKPQLVNGIQRCPASILGVCLYAPENHDYCVVCHEPHERK